MDVKGVHEGLPHRPRIPKPGTLNLSNAILREVNLVALRQVATRMEDVEENAVEKHHRPLEEVEEPLVSDQDGYLGPVEVVLVPPDLRGAKVLDGAEDGSHQDERDAHVQRDERRAQRPVVDAIGTASAVEGDGQPDEDNGHDHHEDERRLDYVVAELRLAGSEGPVGRVRGTDSVQRLDNQGDEAKGSEDTAWMKR